MFIINVFTYIIFKFNEEELAFTICGALAGCYICTVNCKSVM